MKEDYIALKFSLSSPIFFGLGAYAVCEFGLFEVTDIQKPNYNDRTGGYDYELKLNSYYWKWKNKIFKYAPEVAGQEASWNLTATLDVHAGIILRNLNALGYKYNNLDFSFSIDSSVENKPQLMSYSNISILDALFEMAKKWDCECWVSDSIIHFGKLENSTPINFEIGKNVESMSRSDSKNDFATRLYVFGSERNLPAHYRNRLLFTTDDVRGNEFRDSKKIVTAENFYEDSVDGLLPIDICSENYSKVEKDETLYSHSVSVGNLKAGSYKIFRKGGNSAEFSLHNASMFHNIDGNVSLKINLNYTLHSQQKTVNLYDKTLEYRKRNIVAVVESLQFSLTDDAEQAELEFRAEFKAQKMILSCSVVICATLICASSATVDVHFLSGNNSGKTLTCILNADKSLDEEKSTLIRLPKGTTVGMGDSYSITNINRSSLPSSYFDSPDEVLVNGVVQKRLMLPEGIPYIDAYPNMTESEAIEQVVVFDDVFPKTECVVGKVASYTSTIKDESTENPDDTITETFYYFTDTSGFVFKKEYRLPNEDLKVQFQSGKLNGLQFGCTFRTKGETLDGKKLESDVYEIVANEDYGRKLPDKTLLPATGDKFILIGWDSTKIGDTSLITTAEKKLKEKGDKAMAKMKIDPSTYSCKMMSDAIYSADGLHNLYEAGQKVNLVNKAFFENGRVSRIIGFEYALDIPYDSPTYIVGETASYSRIGDLEEKLDELVLNGQTFVGGNGSGVYLITSYDQTPATEKNTFSAKRLVRELAKLLRKDSPDSTAYLLKLLGGAEVGEAIKSFIAGKGTILDSHGLIQTDRLEVRNSLKVLELIINRLQGMENDFVFSPTRKVNKVEKVDATTYKLFLDPKMDGDLIPVREGNILYSIVNDLLTGGSNYYTSYMRVLTTNQNEYSITVVLYPDAEVPGGKNCPPAPGYNISRRGDVHLPSEGQSNPDSQSWYISSSEGRLLFLQNVIKPVLEDYNYALSIGKFPRIKALDKLPISKDEVGIMAQTIVVENLYQYDYNGDVVARKVNRGAWAREVAVSDKPYRNVRHETNKPTGTEYTLLEQHTVYHLGCLWGCLTDKTQEEPKWNAQGWQLLEGNSELAVSIASDNGDDFYCGEVDTNLEVRVYYGHNDITEDVLAHPGAGMEWFRDTGDAPADNLWKPNYVDGSKLKVHIDNSNQHGVGSKFGFETKRVVFTCDVFVPVDGGTEKLTATYGWAMG